MKSEVTNIEMQVAPGRAYYELFEPHRELVKRKRDDGYMYKDTEKSGIAMPVMFLSDEPIIAKPTKITLLIMAYELTKEKPWNLLWN